MKRILFCLALLAAFALSACGTQTEAPENTAVPMDGDEAPQYDPSNPLANYLDHSNLDDETLSHATQSLDVYLARSALRNLRVLVLLLSVP